VPSRERGCLPNDPFKLLLPDVRRDFAVHLAGAQGHSQSLRHIFLYGVRYVVVLVCRADPYFGRAPVLELAGTELAELGARDQRQDDIGREPLLDGGLDAQAVRGVDEDACVLRRHDGIDYGSEIVDIGERLDAEDDIVERALFPGCRFFRGSDDCSRAHPSQRNLQQNATRENRNLGREREREREREEGKKVR